MRYDIYICVIRRLKFKEQKTRLTLHEHDDDDDDDDELNTYKRCSFISLI